MKPRHGKRDKSDDSAPMPDNTPAKHPDPAPEAPADATGGKYESGHQVGHEI
jgi:hypothetical protein